MREAVTLAQMAQIIEKMIQEGCDGNDAAARNVLEYTWGWAMPMAQAKDGNEDGQIVYLVSRDDDSVSEGTLDC